MCCWRPTIATSMDEVDAGHIVFTGPIDEYFGFRFGKLPYRSLRFEHKMLDQEWFQPVAVVNYPRPAGALHADHRIQAPDRPERIRRPASPTNIRARRAILITRSRGRRIRRCSRSTRRWRTRRPDVTFVGRLATYRYYNMDQVVGQALAAFRRLDAQARRRGQAAPPASSWTEAAE